jgi:hypothetical protein
MTKEVTSDFCIIGPDMKPVHVYENHVKGLAFQAKETYSTLFIKPATGQDHLDTFIHEGIHVCLPNATEKQVATYANFLSGLLWKAGYRRLNEIKRKSVRRGRSGGKREA